MLRACGNQVRLGMGGPGGLDFGAIMLMAQAQGMDVDMVAATLPSVEVAVLRAWAGEGGDEADDLGEEG